MIYTLWVHIPSFPEKGFITGSNDLQDSIQSFRIERNSSVVKVLGIDQSVAQKQLARAPTLLRSLEVAHGLLFALPRNESPIRELTPLLWISCQDLLCIVPKNYLDSTFSWEDFGVGPEPRKRTDCKH
ncbi:hypothetical protein Tco_1041208 [Tanacetum coccineum]|uniref:Uncharacterized protein n=1 Tax=Tanacetum coccineum TaxID=301880 RepID=A0ABQ5GI48_9ASTR